MSLRRRIAANSQSLQKTFPEIYRDLFSRCSIVCSAPGNFYWSGEYAVRYGGIAVKQNLPLRTYVGLEAGTAPGLTIELARHWVPSQRAFSQYAASALPALERISRIITEHFEREGTHLPALKASVVMEVPPGCGLAASASFATALSSALHLYLGKTTPSELARWARQTAVQLTADQAFNNVFHLAWEIEDCIHGATPLTSSGVGPFSSFIGSIYPIVYVRHYRTDADTGGTLHYWAIRMDELYNLKQRPSWPIDFGLIYSGDAGETSASLAAIESFKDDIEERLRAVRGELANYPALQPLLDASFFAEKSKQEIWQRLIEAPKLASIMVLGAFKQLFKSGLTEDGAQKLFKALNMAQGSLSFASVSSPVIDYLCLTLTREVRRLQDIYGAGAKLTGRGRSGDVLFAVAYHGLRDTIHKLIARMRRETKEDFYLDYASWLDGFEEAGVKVEQSLGEGIYSEFISRGALQVRYTNREGATSSRLYSVEQFNEDKPAMDVLLDPAKNKIYLAGTQLTSKELRSASATIELLRILLSQLGEPISNKDLPPSSYAQDRNELQSKIITPFAHAVQKRLKADINLKVSGPIRNFTVTLTPGGVDFYVIDKVF